jgi:alpha-galactosidase
MPLSLAQFGSAACLGWILLSQLAAAVSPAPDEMAEARRWMAGAFEGGPEAKPWLSFTYGGKSSAELLVAREWKPTGRKLDDQRTERTITWTDPKTGLEVRCTSVEYSDFPVVEWTVCLRNTGENDTPLLENIQALDARWDRNDGGEFVLRGIRGDDCTPNSYEPYEHTLGPNAKKTFAPGGGRPTDTAFPYYNLSMPGGGLIVVVGWPGQWASSFTRDAAKGLRITAGQELTHLCLKPGEEIRTPLMALLFWKGSDHVRAQNLWRRWMLAHNVPKPDGKALEPISVAGCEGFFQFMDGIPEMRQSAEAYLKAGIRLDHWWRDAGWYPVKQPNWWWVGTWEPDPKRFPNGFRPFSDWLHTQGLKFIVWFEPERVTNGTWLANNHPEWLFGGQKAGTDLHLLNLGNPDARQWLTGHVDRILTEQGIDLYRQDFNCGPLVFWRSYDAPDRQGINENIHVQGYLAYWDELLRRHPGMLIDSCASGGRRNDLETLRRAVPLLRSDYQGGPDTAVGNQGHTYGISSWIPFYGSGVNTTDKYTSRSYFMPSLMVSVDARGNVDWPVVRQIYDDCRKVAPYMLGDYYPLTPYSLDNSQWIGWQFDCPEKGEGVVQAFRRAQSPYESIRVKLRGLDAGAVYTLTNFDAAGTTEVMGRELLEKGVPIVMKDQPDSTVILYKRRP